MTEITLKLRTVKAVIPKLNPGGDCGACVLSGLTGLPVAECYQFQDDGKVYPYSRRTMEAALHRINPKRLIADVPVWMYVEYDDHPDMVWGKPGWEMWSAWFKYVRMAAEAGYYGVCAIQSDGSGPPCHDHWVTLCGVREYWKEHPTLSGSKSLESEVLVSCSNRGEWWVCAEEFLRKYGGFDVMLVQPSEAA